MRLLIISHTPHYQDDSGVVGWAPTVREIDQLASRFSHVRHVAPLHGGLPPASSAGYSAENVELVPVAPSGGDGFLGKLDALRASPGYARTINRELENADMVHVRAPANIAMVAMLLVRGKRGPRARWFKYAGNWKPTRKESATYTAQRLWLERGRHAGIVTVNGRWPGQPPWVRTFYNPSLDNAELERGRVAAASKSLTSPLQLIYVGQLLESKGGGRAVEILARVRALGIDARLTIYGDGPDRGKFENLAVSTQTSAHVEFAGWRPAADLAAAYARTHFVLLPSASEGWPKVLSEGMAYGALPIAGAVSSIPQYLQEFAIGAACDPSDREAFARAIVAYAAAPDRWQRESRVAVSSARTFSFEHYLEQVDDLLTYFGLPMPAVRGTAVS
jgi:glycosyltransferase involved in cell wall biosynthesis